MGTHPIFESDFDCLTEMVLGEVQNLDPSSLLHKVESLLEEAEEALKIDADLGEIESRIKSLALQTHTVTCQSSRSKLELNVKCAEKIFQADRLLKKSPRNLKEKCQIFVEISECARQLKSYQTSSKSAVISRFWKKMKIFNPMKEVTAAWIDSVQINEQKIRVSLTSNDLMSCLEIIKRRNFFEGKVFEAFFGFMRSKKKIFFKNDAIMISDAPMNPLENINAILAFIIHLKKNCFEFNENFIDEFENILLMYYLADHIPTNESENEIFRKNLTALFERFHEIELSLPKLQDYAKKLSKKIKTSEITKLAEKTRKMIQDERLNSTFIPSETENEENSQCQALVISNKGPGSSLPVFQSRDRPISVRC